MSTNHDILQLSKRIASTHDWSAAKAFKAYTMAEDDRAAISRCGMDILAIYPASLGTSATISAALAIGLERAMKAPIHVIRGQLWVDGRLAEPVWHWVMIGPYIIDISLFRHAYSSKASTILAKHIDLVFGPNKALYVDHWSMTKRLGLRYQPEAVLSPTQVNALMGEAFHHIRDARAPISSD